MQRMRPSSHRLRFGRSSLAGGIYLVTFTTFDRCKRFGNFDTASSVSRVLAAPQNWPDARLLAWVLMPDHWHGLIELGEHESLSRSVARAKAAVCRNWRKVCGTDAPLWAPGFHDHALRKEASVRHCARYIIRNPVRAGLVRRCGDYPYWDAIWMP